MSFGSGTTFDPNTKVYSFNVKDKDLPAPQFQVTVKEGDKYVELAPATRVNGNLVGLRVKENKYQNKVIRSVTATLRDNNEVYFINIPFTYLGRNILNGILGLQAVGFDGIELGLYRGKPKTEGKQGFSSHYLKKNGQSVYGKYEWKELPAITKVEVNGEMIGQTKPQDDFFIKEINELATVLKGVANAPHEESVSAPGADKEDSSDVPF